jgi:hypothetical protein
VIILETRAEEGISTLRPAGEAGPSKTWRPSQRSRYR